MALGIIGAIIISKLHSTFVWGRVNYRLLFLYPYSFFLSLRSCFLLSNLCAKELKL